LLLSSSLEAFTRSVICYTAICDLRGQRPRLSESLSVALKRALPVFGLSLIHGAAWKLGFRFYVIPGLFVAALLPASLPVCLIEKTGPLRSIVRGITLLRGHFWPIFGAIGFTALFLQALYKLIGFGIHNWRISMFAIWPIEVVAITAFATFDAVLYHDLRLSRERPIPESLATASSSDPPQPGSDYTLAN
jgi:hypothetical protein